MIYNKIDEHIKNVFKNVVNVENIDFLPPKEELLNLHYNKLYKTKFACISVNIVDFVKMKEHVEDKYFNAIIKEFNYGVIKIMKEYIIPSKIKIDQDTIWAVYPTKTKEHIDQVFLTTNALNTFKKHLNKIITNKFGENFLCGDNFYCANNEFNFGIGASFSLENLFSLVGEKENKEVVFIGRALECSKMLAKNASRSNYDSILIDELLYENLTNNQKIIIEELGSMSRVYTLEPFESDEMIYECDFLIENYNNFVENNV